MLTDIQTIDLTGIWRFQPDPFDDGEAAGYFKPEHNITPWREAMVPSTFDRTMPWLAGYEGMAWYRRDIHIPDIWRDRFIRIHFEGTNYHTTVWVNGIEVGKNDDGFLPFAFPIQGQLKFGARNSFTVRVDNYRWPENVPGKQRGWRPYGGILREVLLVASDHRHIEHVRIVAMPQGNGGSISAAVRIQNAGWDSADVRISLTLSDTDGTPLAQYDADVAPVAGGADAEIRLEGAAPGVEAWSPEHPKLYQAALELHVRDHVVDRQVVQIGFRTIAVNNGQLLLNGRPIFLTGFNRHEDSPRTDLCPDDELTQQDLLTMKQMGYNYVRLCHYPHYPGELRMCDEIGLLVMAEIPLYWWRGYEEGPEHHVQKLDAARRQLRRMIERDANHPSIVVWSVSNETDEQRPEVAAGNDELVKLVKALDPSRLATHGSNVWHISPHFEHDDLICVDGYPTLRYRTRERKAGATGEDGRRWWAEQLPQLHAQYPHKPILISEFGYPALEGVNQNAASEDAQAEALQHEFAAFDLPYVYGTTVWCYADHPWPEEEFIRRITISPYGVVSRDRHAKRAFTVVRELYRRKQGLRDAAPAQAQVAALELEDIPVHMVRPDMQGIPVVPFPDGYTIHGMLPGDGRVWTDIQRDAERLFPINDDLFNVEFGSDPAAQAWRCFLMTNAAGVAIGTISAWYSRDYMGQEWGRIHWFAIRPAYHGKGLARPALSYALQKLAEWHLRAWLATSSQRIPAIKLYLDFGFLPRMDVPRAQEAWQQVRAKLKHPALERLRT